MNAQPRLSVVLPCYNEARGIPLILERFAEVGRGADFELILVDNGSTDQTPTVLKQTITDYPFARSIRVEPNRGYGHGIYQGLLEARGRYLAWSHADLQTDPADIFKAWQNVLAASAPEATLVKGHRQGRAWSEKMVSLGMQTLATLVLRRPMQEINAQPKVFARGLLRLLANPPIDFNFDLYVLYMAHRNGWSIRSIPVRFPPRTYGQSHWSATWQSKWRTIRGCVRYMCRLGFGRMGSPPDPVVARIAYPTDKTVNRAA